MYSKKLIIPIIVILFTNITLYCAFRKTTAKLAYITEPLQKQIRSLPIWQHVNRLYAPFQHKLYTGLIEPIYVGNKAPINAIHLHDQINQMMMNAHDKFKNKNYKNWKKRLTINQLLEHEEKINAYEEAYRNYKLSSLDPEKHEELLRRTQEIHELMTHTRALLPLRMFDKVYG